MRDDYQSFKKHGAEIVVVTRHDRQRMRAYWTKQKLPLIGIADPQGAITARFGQQWRLFSLGRMPAQFIIDCEGRVSLAHYGKAMSDIVPNGRMIEALRRSVTASHCPDNRQ